MEKRFAFQPNGLLDVEIDAATELAWAMVLGPGVRNPSTEEMDNRFARRSAVYRHAEACEEDRSCASQSRRGPLRHRSAVGGSRRQLFSDRHRAARRGSKEWLFNPWW